MRKQSFTVLMMEIRRKGNFLELFSCCIIFMMVVRCCFKRNLLLGLSLNFFCFLFLDVSKNKKNDQVINTSETCFFFFFFRRWAGTTCAMDSLYDLELISETVPVILDNSKIWYHVLMTSMKLGARGVAHVEGVSRVNLNDNRRYSNLLLINRTASPLSW